MRSVLKIAELESRFPILAVENNCIVSKDGDITVAYEVELPELYTVTSAEYEAMHGTWVKAIKVLPAFSVVYKQDWFTRKATLRRETLRKASCPGAMPAISTSAPICGTAVSCT